MASSNSLPCMCFNTCSSCEEQRRRSRRPIRQKRFNTCSSCEEQPAPSDWATSSIGFQYMLLLRGATLACLLPFRRLLRFNTCSSCEEQLGSGRVAFLIFNVSIHAPLARSNYMAGIRKGLRMFQYMLLLRGATITVRYFSILGSVSIHAPLARSNCTDVNAFPGHKFQYMLLLRGATVFLHV